MSEGGSGLLGLPLGVKIPLLPGSKPVFCRTKLGEKVKEVERGRRALLLSLAGVEGGSWLPGADLRFKGWA